MTHVLDAPDVRTPLMMYLFHRLQQLLDGRRLVIDVDEFWKALGDEAFRGLAQDGLKTFRKQNALLVLGTQSPADVLRSPIAHTIVEQCATKIYLPNPHAAERDYVDGFGLTQREFALVRDELSPAQRRFLVKQGLDSVVAELDLTGLDDALAVLSGRTETVDLLDRIRAAHGDDPADWMAPLPGRAEAPAMKSRLPLTLAWALATAPPASAQIVVHDPTSYASLLKQATTALDQLKELQAQVAEAKRLYDGFNTASGAGALAGALKSPELRAFIPDIDRYVAAARGDLGALGELGRRAAGIRADQRLYTAPADDPLGQALEREGDRAARDLALGQAAAQAGAKRQAGLEELLSALDSAPDVRAVLDLQARLLAEQAMGQNDQMRLQGLAMAQDAEERLQAQRNRERAAAAREARLQRYRSGF
nr:type IV secretion system protein [Phenylobacterium sp. J367]